MIKTDRLHAGYWYSYEASNGRMLKAFRVFFPRQRAERSARKHNN
jgi:hypothetical protein